MTLSLTMRGGYDGGWPIDLHYGAAAVRVKFLAIFYVEAPVQILLRPQKFIF